MKNKFSALFALFALTISILGCSFYNPSTVEKPSANANEKTLTDKAIDSTIGEEKIGIKECDEVIEFFAKQYENPEDDFVTKATKQYALNTIRENFRSSLEQYKNDKTKMAKECRNFKEQLDKFSSETPAEKK